MKKYIITRGILAGLGLLAGCKKQDIISPAYAMAYTRIVMMDAPGSSKLQFYLDGKVNANGDSVMYNPDGTIFAPDQSLSTTSLINYPSGGWTDNAPVNFVGTNGNYYSPGSGFAVFPNPTDRIPLAPIINGYNYYKWAALPANNHQATFYGVVSATQFGNKVYAKGSRFLDQQVNLEGGAIQTFFLLNQAPCKLYSTSGINGTKGLPIYAVQENIDYYSNQFSLISVKDHPGKLPAFHDSSAYIRFVNVTPNYLDQGLNANTDSLDIYLAPLFGTRPDYYYPFGRKVFQNIDSVGKELLVSSRLGRFTSTVDAPFFEINLSAQMRNQDTAIAPGQPRIPRYYRVLAYPAGHSAATGDLPVGQGDWLAVYNSFSAYDYSNPLAPPLGTFLDSWLLRSDGTSLHPSISTIMIAVGLNAYPNTVSTNYLGFRSSINYTQEGINKVYYK